MILPKNKYGNLIYCKFFNPSNKNICEFDSYTHNGFLDCDEKGYCIYNKRNNLWYREGKWVPLL